MHELSDADTADLAELRAALARERARADRLQAENDDLRLLLASLRQSTLWRLIAPLRWLGSRAGGLRRLARGLRRRAAARRLRRGGLFDAAWYRAHTPDLGGMDPVLHYLSIGADQDRDPGPGFSTAFYRRRYPDSAAMNPLLHYLTIGRAEGRLPRPAAAEARADGAPAVAFVSGDPGTVSEDYRVRHPLAFLREAGLTAEVVAADAVGAAAHLAAARLLVLFRAPWSPGLEALVERAHAQGAVVVYDVDDLVFEPDLGTAAHVDGLRHLPPQDIPIYRERLHLNRRALELADTCVLSTGFLAERVLALGKPAHVLANGLDAAMLAAADAAPPRPADGRLRIGYASGTLTHQKDFATAAPAIAALLAARPEAMLTVVGRLLLDAFPDLAPFAGRIEQRPPVPHARLFEEIARFDINIAPLEAGNPFCDAKSELKYLHAGILGIPTVASPTPPFREAITPEVTGLLAATPEDWRAGLLRLAGDAALRRRLGDAARDDVLRRYGPAAKAAATLALYRALAPDLEKSA